ncbi:hypothetical protein B0H11DRAFT_82453 [Mycena galericulata]|nr:hypothetical protein B0H11DRAFT_82453 [Mycena galericulata]
MDRHGCAVGFRRRRKREGEGTLRCSASCRGRRRRSCKRRRRERRVSDSRHMPTSRRISRGRKASSGGCSGPWAVGFRQRRGGGRRDSAMFSVLSGPPATESRARGGSPILAVSRRHVESCASDSSGEARGAIEEMSTCEWADFDGYGGGGATRPRRDAPAPVSPSQIHRLPSPSFSRARRDAKAKSTGGGRENHRPPFTAPPPSHTFPLPPNQIRSNQIPRGYTQQRQKPPRVAQGHMRVGSCFVIRTSGAAMWSGGDESYFVSMRRGGVGVGVELSECALRQHPRPRLSASHPRRESLCMSGVLYYVRGRQRSRISYLLSKAGCGATGCGWECTRPGHSCCTPIALDASGRHSCVFGGAESSRFGERMRDAAIKMKRRGRRLR